MKTSDVSPGKNKLEIKRQPPGARRLKVDLVSYILDLVKVAPLQSYKIKLALQEGKVTSFMEHTSGTVWPVVEGNLDLVNPFQIIAESVFTERLASAIVEIGLYGSIEIELDMGVIKTIRFNKQYSLLPDFFAFANIIKEQGC